MKIIGLTGGIACGKTTISQYLRQKGYPVIDADQIGREVLAKGSPGLAQVKKCFGAEYIDENGALLRKKLGSVVFGDAAELEKLNQITQPLIADRIKQEIEKQKDGIIFLDAAVLLENHMEGLCNRIWVVGTDSDTQMDRIMKRDHLSQKEAQNRIHSQLSTEEKRKYADVYIDNSGSIEDVLREVDRFLADEREGIER